MNNFSQENYNNPNTNHTVLLEQETSFITRLWDTGKLQAMGIGYEGYRRLLDEARAKHQTALNLKNAVNPGVVQKSVPLTPENRQQLKKIGL